MSRTQRFDRLLARRVLAIALLMSVATAARSVADETDSGVTPQWLALAERVDALGADRLKSSDLRLRILYSMSDDVETERRPDNGFYGKERISAADLYEQARGSTDPLTLDLLIRRCTAYTKTMTRCDRLALARRWTEADTQNQIAWLSLAGILKEEGAAEAAKGAFKRAALASAWHEHYGEVARLVTRTIPTGLTLQEREFALLGALMKAKYADPGRPLQTLWTFCKDDDAGVRAACRRIVRVMARDGETLLGISMAVRYAAKVGLDRETVQAYQRTADAIQWSMPYIAGTGDFREVSDDPTAQANIARMQALIAVGERRRSLEVLLERHVSEDDAAQRYVATLSAEQLARRTDRLAGR